MKKDIINNSTFRRFLLSSNGLNGHISERIQLVGRKNIKWLHQTVSDLGFVQIDPISIVERAHHHILFSRNKFFEKEWLKKSLEVDRTVFENWTHDASILPVQTFPYWRYYFDRFNRFD